MGKKLKTGTALPANEDLIGAAVRWRAGRPPAQRQMNEDDWPDVKRYCLFYVERSYAVFWSVNAFVGKSLLQVWTRFECKTINSDLPTADETQARNREKTIGIDKQEGCGFSHNNAKPHTSSATQQILKESGWKVRRSSPTFYETPPGEMKEEKNRHAAAAKRQFHGRFRIQLRERLHLSTYS
ncbi:hypothetical protein EVAR_62069_1 [Eumeta japonica]|uniref:Histone-lysine N-methyltransferase SETMAR n=1 Tax=Eumeta variegata TaxID=151549 RepID=A0A4C1YSQ1_EUMVA|nr:hypothetical protein EVAR_62069_1 [Eumeta japonica]